MDEKEKKERQYRVITFLSRQELDFLDELEKDLYFSYGIHIPRTKLIEEIIEAFKDKNNKQILEQNLLQRFKEETNLEKPTP